MASTATKTQNYAAKVTKIDENSYAVKFFLRHIKTGEIVEKILTCSAEDFKKGLEYTAIELMKNEEYKEYKLESVLNLAQRYENFADFEAQKPTHIMLHYPVIVNKNREKAVEYMQHIANNPNENTVVSFHYLVTKTGEVLEFVAPEYRAYHAGGGFFEKGSYLSHKSSTDMLNKDGNNSSIGIEIEGMGCGFTQEQVSAVNKLIFDLWKNNIVDHNVVIVGHSDWSPSRKSDPGIHLNWQECIPEELRPPIPKEYLANMQKAQGKEAKIEVISTKSESFSDFKEQNPEYMDNLQEALKKLGYLNSKNQDIELALINLYSKYNCTICQTLSRCTQENLDNLSKISQNWHVKAYEGMPTAEIVEGKFDFILKNAEKHEIKLDKEIVFTDNKYEEYARYLKLTINNGEKCKDLYFPYCDLDRQEKIAAKIEGNGNDLFALEKYKNTYYSCYSNKTEDHSLIKKLGLMENVGKAEKSLGIIQIKSPNQDVYYDALKFAENEVIFYEKHLSDVKLSEVIA
jgi:N-acetyl-anhydromuramyl-L-alanine amidase AmpD